MSIKKNLYKSFYIHNNVFDDRFKILQMFQYWNYKHGYNKFGLWLKLLPQKNHYQYPGMRSATNQQHFDKTKKKTFWIVK